MLRSSIDAFSTAFSLVLIAVPGLIINFFEVLSLLVHPISLTAFRLINIYLVSFHWPILVWLIEKWAKVEIKMYGDTIPAGETALGLLNHRSDVDWIIGFAFCGRKCLLGSLKVIVKTGHKMIPIFGWMEQFVEFIFVKRNWQEDRSQLEKGLCNLISYPKPFWFIIFPEGTRFNKARMEENQRWSRENGRKPLSHVLWPRAKAFLMTVESLGKTIDACYDATLAFERDVSFFDMLRGRGNTVVHFHVKRYSMAKLHAMSADALTAWLDERWVEKEALLEKFARDRSYGLPEVKSEKPMPSGRVVAAWLLCLLVILSRIPLTWLLSGAAGLGGFILVAVALLQLQLKPSRLSGPKSAAAAAT